jgi:hypothetical protein
VNRAAPQPIEPIESVEQAWPWLPWAYAAAVVLTPAISYLIDHLQ